MEPRETVFVAEKTLSADQKKRLEDALVVSLQHQLPGMGAFWRGDKGLVFSPADFALALDVLGASVVSSKPLDPGMRRVELAFDRPQKPVASICCWPTDKPVSDRYLAIVRDMVLPACNSDVVLHHASGKTVAMPSQGKTELFIHGSVARAGSVVHPLSHEIWGYPTANRHLGRLPASASGYEIQDSRGLPLCEVIERAAFILFDPVANGSPSELDLFRLLCAQIVLVLQGKLDELDAHVAELRQQRTARIRDLFVGQCCRGIDQTIAATRASWQSAADNTARLTQQLILSTRAENEHRARLDGLTEDRGNFAARFANELSALAEDPKILDITIDGDVVTVFTDTLYCMNPDTDRYHEIGRMRFYIYLSGNSNGIIAANLTRTLTKSGGGHHHPHIFEDGRLCFGNTTERFAKLIAEYEIAAVVWLAIQFVESVNTRDAYGRTIEKWPLVPVEEEEELRAAHRLRE